MLFILLMCIIFQPNTWGEIEMSFIFSVMDYAIKYGMNQEVIYKFLYSK